MSKVKNNVSNKNNASKNVINPEIENKFKLLLKIMSWVVGVCFVLIILLPLINSNFIDILVKVLYFIGLINLLLFAILEFFGHNIKVLLSKNKV